MIIMKYYMMFFVSCYKYHLKLAEYYRSLLKAEINKENNPEEYNQLEKAIYIYSKLIICNILFYPLYYHLLYQH